MQLAESMMASRQPRPFINALIWVALLLLPNVWTHSSHSMEEMGVLEPIQMIDDQALLLRLGGESSPLASKVKDFSWTDRRLQEALSADSGRPRGILQPFPSAAKHALVERSDPDPMADYDVTLDEAGDQALISIRCLLCAKDQSPEVSRDDLEVAPVDAAEYTVKKMIELMRMDKPNRDKRSCVFYTQRSKENWQLRSLSKAAEEFVEKQGCDKFRSFWDMWSAEWRDKNKDTNCAVDRENYYCLWHKKPFCCWMNGFFSRMKGWDSSDMKKREYVNVQYFERMSKAYATTCTGNVYILSELKGDAFWKDPPAPKQPSIWWSHELPVFREKRDRGENIRIILVEYDTDHVTEKLFDIIEGVLKFRESINPETKVPLSFAYKNTKDWAPDENIAGHRLIGGLLGNMTDAGAGHIANWSDISLAELSSPTRLLSGFEETKEDAISRRKTCNSGANVESEGEDWFR